MSLPRCLCWQNRQRRAATLDHPFLISVPPRVSFEFGGTKRMDSPGTKQQTLRMDTTTQSYLHTELERRRASLEAAAGANASDTSIHNLLQSVDEALARLNGGTFGICEV